MAGPKDIFNPLLEKRFQKVYVPDVHLPYPTAQTTDATPMLLSNSKVIAEDTVLSFEVYIVAVQTGGSAGTLGDAFARKYVGMIKNIGGTTSIVDEVWYEDIVFDDQLAGLVITITADNPTNELRIQVTGEADKNISWKAKVEFNSISYS